MYIRSTMTGQIYRVDFLPRFGGYELACEEEYLAWCEAHGIKEG